MGASERDEWLRAAWWVMVAAQIDPERLVFVDEMGTNTSLSPVYAWAPKGRRAYCSVPRNRRKNTTLLSSMSLSGMRPSLAVDGPTDREVFEAYVERVLAPTQRRTSGGDGQPRRPQGRAGEGARRAQGLRAPFPAALLAGPQPHRARFLQGEGAVEEGSDQNP